MTSNGLKIAAIGFGLGLLFSCVLEDKSKEEEELDPNIGEVEDENTDGNDAVAVNRPASSCDGVEPLPDAIEEDLTVGPGCVRIDDTHVNGDANLTILPGTRVEFAPGAFLSAARNGGSATITAIGTEAEPITFTSSNANPRAGDWQCIHLDGDGSELDHVIVEYGGAACGATGAGREGMIQIYGSPRGITNVTVRGSSTVGVQLNGTPTLFENNRFEANTQAPIRASANSLSSIGPANTFEAADVILVDTDLVTRSGTWANHGVPYRLTGGFAIQGDITVEAGVRVEMTDGTLDVATFDVLGTAEAPVVFTSAQPNPTAGDWGCIVSAAALRIEHAVFEYAGSGDGCTGAGRQVALVVDAGSIITDTVFRNIRGAALYNFDCGVVDAWCVNEFENVETGPILCSDGPAACP